MMLANSKAVMRRAAVAPSRNAVPAVLPRGLVVRKFKVRMQQDMVHRSAFAADLPDKTDAAKMHEG